MQFRIRGGKEEYLRSSYDPEKKRSVQKLVQLGDLTPGELEQLGEWRQKGERDRLARDRTECAKHASSAIHDIADALENGHTNTDEASLFGALDRLRKAMRKAGIKRPVKVSKLSDTHTAPLNLS